MADLAPVIPRKRSPTYMSEPIEGDSAFHKIKKGRTTQKEKDTGALGLESDKENAIKPSENDVSYVASKSTHGEGRSETVSDPAFSAEADQEVGERSSTGNGFGKQINDTTLEFLLSKKYGTKPPPWRQRRALKISPMVKSYLAHSRWYLYGYSSDTDSENDLSPLSDSEQHRERREQHSHSSKARATTAAKPQKVSHYDTENTNSNTTPISSSIRDMPASTRTIVNGRAMITASKVASKLQKIIPGFPTPQEPFPEDFTLTELCTQYPNHLFGDNLLPFLQSGWSAARITNLLPAQHSVSDNEKVTANGIASRLRKAMFALEKLGEYDVLVNSPKTHSEL